MGTLGETKAKDLQRARTKVPRPAYKGRTFTDMTVKLNGFLKAYPNTKDCKSWSTSELQQLQLRMLQLRSSELDEVYQASDDNRQLRGDANLHLQRWEMLRNVSGNLDGPFHHMQRDGHCHEAVMWFVHHLSEATRQRLAEEVQIPLPQTTLIRALAHCHPISNSSATSMSSKANVSNATASRTT